MPGEVESDGSLSPIRSEESGNVNNTVQGAVARALKQRSVPKYRAVGDDSVTNSFVTYASLPNEGEEDNDDDNIDVPIARIPQQQVKPRKAIVYRAVGEDSTALTPTTFKSPEDSNPLDDEDEHGDTTFQSTVTATFASVPSLVGRTPMTSGSASSKRSRALDDTLGMESPVEQTRSQRSQLLQTENSAQSLSTPNGPQPSKPPSTTAKSPSVPSPLPIPTFQPPDNALTDLLASSAKARQRRLAMLAERSKPLRTPSPVNNTLNSTIATPKSVSFRTNLTETMGSPDAADSTSMQSASQQIQQVNISSDKNITPPNINVNDDDDNDDDDGPGFQMADDQPQTQEESQDTTTQETTQETILEDEADDASVRSSEQEEEPDLEPSQLDEDHQDDESTKEEEETQTTTDDEDEEREAVSSSRRKSSVTPKKSRPNKRSRRVANSDSESDFDQIDQTPVIKTRVGDSLYELVPVTEYKPSIDSDDEGLRRSHRARIPPLQWWKNERIIFESADRRSSAMGLVQRAKADMSIATKVQLALPTPEKPKRRTKPKRATSTQKLDLPPFDDSPLRAKLSIQDGNDALVWDEETNDIVERRTVMRSGDLAFSELPITSGRARGESKAVGLASQAFNVSGMKDHIPGWISGQLILPPRAIKDAEGVGDCSQVFFVGDCQPNSLEVALSNPEEPDFDPSTAQRFLLSKGDFFHVPPNNVYRAENHSIKTECHLYWTIIRPMQH